MAPKKTYHHGDLRNALLAAALALIEENGLEGLSLRKVAARVGVSHAAPEHHFPTMRHLMNAMATAGFEMFARSMAEERAQALPTPVEQIRAAFRGYLSYARQHPGLFRLMFTANLLDWTDEALREHARLGYRQLEEICAPAAAFMGLQSEAERRSLESLLWSQVHGHAHLVIDQKLPDAADADCPFPGKPLDIAGLIFGVGRC
ncbi:TetR/AcrR family transcriptional regulator [Rhizobium sp. TH2]|uniref:TetR/AcrR family transcriptional regulator n=1 Tax=Rhizobium sp. TH2 TaxID=2775403 RepID=UPI002158733C|nr:TetR/AcrR family transcriptional regulator [Rhizobium sp. TH2]UVC07745.1 TetR/AcrR family transcriptional regulator [Rhizobium sp. TH2]